MSGKELAQKVRNRLRLPLPLFKAWNGRKPRFVCPICNYEGPFADFRSFAGFRKHAICPSCGSLERHRLQYLVAADCLKGLGAQRRMLHVAPEKFLSAIFSVQFPAYETADLFMKGVNHKVDLTNLPFPDASYDVVFASHVLEHISDDRRAIGEIRRILRSGGIAILPVPVVCEKTIEYPEANPLEAGHVRAPGPDYFERYKEYFSTVKVASSTAYSEKYQLFVYEDRSCWPTKECPLRPPMQGERHSDFVPVCYV
jgi:SAM-dependent methyltransferase